MTILDDLSDHLLVEKSELLKFIRTASYRYKVYKIPKRNGRGFRTIAQPTSVLKDMQRFLVDKHLDSFPVHECATAYKEDVGIKYNAEIHSSNDFLLKMDFSDFFPSIVPPDLFQHWLKYKGVLNPGDDLVLKKLLFWSSKKDHIYRLSIGAPSSPMVSNTIMYEFDCILSSYCAQNGIVYSRYADDLTFSTSIKGRLFNLPEKVKEICNNVSYPSLVINENKTVFSSKKFNRHVTGLVLTNKGEVSIGRAKKRYIKSMVFKYINKDLDSEEVNKVAGYLAYVKDVDVDFYNALGRKFGHSLIYTLMTKRER